MLDFLDLSFFVITIIGALVAAIIFESLPEEYRLEKNNKMFFSVIIGITLSFTIDYYSNQDIILTSNYWD